MRKLGLQMKSHIEERFASYFFVIVLFVVGVSSGAVAVKALSFGQKQDLLSFLQQFFSSGVGLNAGASAFLDTLLINLQLLWLVWLMGILVFGLPMIVVLVFFRGFVLGFSVAFLIAEMAWKGVLFAFCSVIPHNLISVPVALALAGMAVHHAVSTIRPAPNVRRSSYWQKIVSMTAATVAFSGLIAVASLVETYVTPAFVHMVARFF
jgi:stage II sporulation protein M